MKLNIIIKAKKI